jgi:hypothetical protein
MKRIVIAITAILFSGFVFAQKTTEISVAKLPKAATNYIKNNLPGATIARAAKVEDKGVLTYNVSVDIKGKKHLFVFDKDGKFLKKGDALVTTPAPKPAPAAKPQDKPAPDQKVQEK